MRALLARFRERRPGFRTDTSKLSWLLLRRIPACGEYNENRNRTMKSSNQTPAEALFPTSPITSLLLIICLRPQPGEHASYRVHPLVTKRKPVCPEPVVGLR
jgi:hypothetical protein